MVVRPIRARLPEAKLVAVLRNPVERAFSDYLMYVRDGDDRLDFGRALDEQEKRAAPARPPDTTSRPASTAVSSAVLRRLSARAVQVHLFEDFAADPSPCFGALYEFLGVDRTSASRRAGRQRIGRAAEVLARRGLRAGQRVAPLVPEASAAREGGARAWA